MSDKITSNIYLIPQGSAKMDIAAGRTLELLPGYWVNPKQLGVIADVAMEDDAKSLEQEGS